MKVIELRARGEWGVAAFKILGVAVSAVGCVSAAVIELEVRSLGKLEW